MGLKENIQQDPVSSLPLREAIKVSPQTIVRVAVAQLRHRQLGCAIVVDENDHPLGLFTERAVIALLQQDPNLDASCVGDHLDADWLAVKSTDPVAVVLDAILERGLRFVCVTDDEGRTIGLTGQRGLAEYVAEHYPQQVMVQHLGGKRILKEREGA